ncbi:MAG: tryptophan 7-halogenase [Henriciella sp.]
MAAEPIKSIIILGGGTAGWSAAACLSRFLQDQDVSITLVESSQIATVGVGEASIPNIRNFNEFVGLNERSFIESTNGTFKLGIGFHDWAELGSSFFHPFGDYGLSLGEFDFFSCFMKAKETDPNLRLETYSLACQLAKKKRFAQPISDQASTLSQFGYAFHFDATLYAQRLRQLATMRGVEHVDERVADVGLDPETGHISYLALENGLKLEGDLFVDCSGFRALLIEQALQTGYEDWSHWLPCDRAISLPCSSERPDTLKPYTIATARSSGWSWRIPLQHRIGNGYVYASVFQTDEDAQAELEQSLEAPASADPNRQRFTAGMRAKFWNKNCVSLGLASGFIEPLESTSINLVHRALSILMNYFPDRSFDPVLSREANSQFQAEQERVRDFIILHYKLSRRTDTAFWRHVTEQSVPESLARKMDLFQARGKLLNYEFESFEPASWQTLYAGFGVQPRTLDLKLNTVPIDQLKLALSKIETSVEQAAGSALPHHQFIANHFGPAPAQQEIA